MLRAPSSALETNLIAAEDGGLSITDAARDLSYTAAGLAILRRNIY
jgi:hypothetical protein